MSGGGSTRRSRISAEAAVRITIALALAAALAAGCGAPPPRSGSGERTVEIVTHEVSEGETLASIADDFYGSRDAEAYLREVNHIPAGVPVEVGALIDVPAGADDIARYGRRTEAKIHFNRGTEYAERGDVTKAEEEFVASLRVDPRFADAGYNLAVVLLRSGDPERAAAILEQVVRVRDDDPAAWFALGKAYLDRGESDRALGPLGRALALDPSDEDALYARALALLDTGRTEDAIFQLDAYLRAFPDGAWAAQSRDILSRLARASGGAE
jgi:tetratricopeptide (TPR) repeat protein